MRAAVRTQYGGPDVVRIEQAAAPEATPDELLVRVHASTVNRTDCGYRAGTPYFIRFQHGFPRPRFPVLGTEFAGVVERAGDRVRSFAVGDRVFGYVEGRFGAHAEYLAVPEDAPIAQVPADVALETAAAATEGAHYALAFIRVARVHAGQHVLVLGATGGIGSAAVQLLKAGGVQVTAAAREHLEAVAGLRADRVVQAAAEEPPDDGQRYDAVFDAVGKSTFARCRPLLTSSGTYVSSELGPKAQNVGLGLLSPLSRGRRVRFPFPRQDQAMIRRIAGLLGDGRFRPLIDRRVPLDRIVAAYRYVESGGKVGSVVLDLAGTS